MVVQNLNALFGRPEREIPSERRELLRFLVKRRLPRLLREPLGGECREGGKWAE
jgi:hypothetical protein